MPCRGKQWSVLEDLSRRHAMEILGCREYNWSLPFLHSFLYRDPSSDLVAEIVDMIVHLIGVESFMATSPSNRLPIHYAAYYRAMTPSVFATLLALTSAAGLRQRDYGDRIPLDLLHEDDKSPNKVTPAGSCGSRRLRGEVPPAGKCGLRALVFVFVAPSVPPLFPPCFRRF